MTVFALPPCGHFFHDVCRREDVKKFVRVKKVFLSDCYYSSDRELKGLKAIKFV